MMNVMSIHIRIPILHKTVCIPYMQTVFLVHTLGFQTFILGLVINDAI